eukprot:GGOE01007082.1.p1 GENE.GGOE01007082.1~~GGOE01007082.1.p1  ORF type:complete len:355 (-),score=87.80 GGOE01007082.1:378-1403(-)
MSKRKLDDLVTISKKAKENHNTQLCGILEELGEIERNKGDLFRWKAYRNACQALASSEHSVKSGDEARKLPGVGQKIAKKIDEILATGKLQKLEKAKEDPVVAATSLFVQVIGIGPAFASKLVHEYGCRTLEDIDAKHIPLNHQQMLGMKYFEDMKHKIPAAEVKIFKEKVEEEVKKVDQNAFITICGSNRRGKPESGDVDVLLTHPSTSSDSSSKYLYLPRLVQRLRDAGLLIDDLAEGNTKYMGFCRLLQPDARARRVDIRFVPYDCFWTSVLYFTGSDLFNVQMRVHALKKGFTINEYGIWHCDEKGNKKGDKIPCQSEEDIFALVGMTYTPPHERSL